MLDEDATHADLRSGRPPWRVATGRPPRPPLMHSLRCDVVVVGAGITGALMAEHLTRLGHQVCVVDREAEGFGSTAASTAMLLWEIDRSLTELTGLYGFDRAADVYRRSVAAMAGLTALAADRGLPFVRAKPSVYLAAGETGAKDLLEEHALRRRAGLPGDWLDGPTLLREFGFDRAAAIVSPGSADAEPLLLAHGLIDAAIGGGAWVHDGNAESFGTAGRAVVVGLDNGREIEARAAVLATGYVMPDIVRSTLHRTSATWAIATPPQAPEQLWRDGALVWEAAEPYLYARTTADGRIVIGGEDEDGLDDAAREAATPKKTATLLHALSAVWPRATPVAEYAWSGVFGETPDGLPLIGPVPGWPGFYAAYGYGGNGITFSYMASRMIAAMIGGGGEAWHEAYALDRAVPGE